MIATSFRPSLHGWPFGNSFYYSFPYGIYTMKGVGFCGGMCWTSVERFYKHIPIRRDIQKPSKGDELYEEILGVQAVSLPAQTVLKILGWQSSPRYSSGSKSLGYKTKMEWAKVKKYLDGGFPVTITLITSFENSNIDKLKNNHRVVAYAYEERSLLDDEKIHGNKRVGVKVITIYIYDPNYPYDPSPEDDVSDKVNLIFYLGCEDNWIGLRHNQPKEFVYGFFLDEPKRNYKVLPMYAGTENSWLIAL